MGEEADRSEYDRRLASDGEGDDGGSGDCDDGKVLEWEIGLPSSDDLTPLSQPLVPPELASAFSIAPEPARTILDVHRASQSTLSSLRRHNSASSSSALNSFSPYPTDDPMVVEGEDPKDEARVRRSETENSAYDQSLRTLKRPRLAWTPQLHKRFVDVVAHLGIKNAVPKTIMQLMNVEGLTRENVASHLQKYRLYLKRMQGLSNEGPSSSDPLFASTPVLQSLHENAMPAQQQQAPPQQVSMPMPYSVPTIIPMPMFGMPPQQHHSGAMGMVPVNNGHHRGYDCHQPFGGFREQQSKDWANGRKFGTSVVSYPSRITPNDK